MLASQPRSLSQMSLLVVSFITSTWTELLGFTPVSMMSWSYTYVTQPMVFHNIPAGLQIFVLELEAWCQFMWTWEKHKQLCTPSKGLHCRSPVPGLLPESFAEKSVAKDEICLASGGTWVLFGGFSCLLLSPWLAWWLQLQILGHS